jgi:signal transduction histidine kinase
MATQFSLTYLKKLQKISQMTSLVSLGVGLLVLMDWILRIEILQTILPNLAPMKPITASCFVLTGISLWTLCYRDQRFTWLGLGCAIVVAFVGGMTLSESLLDWKSGLTQMPLGSALSFCLISVPLILLHHHSQHWLVIQVLAFVVLFIALLAFVGYLYHVTALYTIGTYSAMSLYSAIGFGLVSIGILFWKADVGLLATLTSEDLGSKIARQMIPPIVVIPILLGWFRLKGQELGYYDTSFGLAIIVTSMMVLMVMLVWRNAHYLNQIDAERQKIERQRSELLDLEQKAKQDALQAKEQLAFLADASVILSSSLDYETTLNQIAQMVVPRIADWCAVDILAEDQTLQRLAVAHVDPAKIELAYEIQRRYPTSSNPERGVYHVIRTGKSEIYPEIPVDMLESAAQDQEHLRLMRELSLKSAMVVPIFAHATVWGVITLVSSSENRRYDLTDLVYAEELARRAAIAIENAQLFKQTQVLNTRLQERIIEYRDLLEQEQKTKQEVIQAQTRLSNLAKISLELSSTLDYEETLQRVAQMSVPHFSDICAVDLLGKDNLLHRVAVGHTEPATAAFIMEMHHKFPPKLDLPFGPYHVLRTGEIEFHAQPSEEEGKKYAIDEEHLELIKAIAPYASIFIPIRLREKTFGVISFISTQAERQYHPEDIEYAQELARRAAIAIENAQLFQQTQQLNAELEQRVQERTLALSLVNKELESFSYSVSHDLRSPLRALDGFSLALFEDYANTLDDEGKNYLHRIRNASQRMGQLIDDLLMLSRVTRTQVQFRRVDLTEMAHQIEADLRELYPNNPVQFNVAENMFVDADERLMRIALTNLLGNAWKFSSKTAHPCVEFGWQEQNGETEYFVRDNGIGFDMTYAHKLFGAFQRLHSTVEFEGTGIGLATVQRVFHKHGGSIRAEGVVGQGATFYFQI